MQEAVYQSMTDEELIKYVLDHQNHNFFAVELALRLEAASEAVEDTDNGTDS